MITLRNIGQHEFIGLKCNITDALNRSNIGLNGEVIDETMKTLTLDVHGAQKKVQKKGTEFMFRLPKGNKVIVNGDKIIARPEDRIKKKIKKW